ncbi:hypothetical protein Vi05172_g10487 [Venturia inaequalis]|uniref:Uncharacterized protein n=1 Tax=Venturia inaequalis TaxID=5025 RepID=A0A8H3VM89_VENIN|nr:hypothetical protein EG327_000648 [Venturia inaequalis]RDI79543.1 hypothetical protein Vi05172_g10487 [Venturia inaequalis]
MPVFFSLDPKFFKNHANSCTIQNGTTVYSNHSIPQDCSCVAPIAADPDFAGPGILTSFIFFSWLTIAVATVPAFYAIRQSWRNNATRKKRRKRMFLAEMFEVQVHDKAKRKQPNNVATAALENGARTSTFSLDGESPKDPELKSKSAKVIDPTYSSPDATVDPRPITIAKKLLASLTDIQAITGLSIILTGMARFPAISYYHQQFASNLWWLTLNSLWISRIDYTDNSPSMSTWRMQVRRITITCSVIIAAVFQIMIALREENHWDPLKPGRCYVRDALGSDIGQNLFWFTGTCIYGVVLLLSLTKRSRNWYAVQIVGRIEPSLNAMWTWARAAGRDLKKYNPEQQALENRGARDGFFKHHATTAILRIKLVSYTLAFITWWCLVQFLSIWSSGTGSHAVELGVYSVFAAANTWWVIAIKVNNIHLIQGNERRWTFGQMLPCALALLVLFHFFDSLDEDPKVSSSGARDLETRREVEEGEEPKTE